MALQEALEGHKKRYSVSTVRFDLGLRRVREENASLASASNVYEVRVKNSEEKKNE